MRTSRFKKTRPTILTLVTLIALSGATGHFLLFHGRVSATQPPPPQNYTLTVTKSGGDDTCEVRIELPVTSDWTTTSVQESFPNGSEYEPAQQITCPSAYKFSHWASNDEDLNGYRENHVLNLTLTQNTVAVAVFEPVLLTPKVTGFAVSGVVFNSQTGTLVIETTWGSTSGNLADLTGQAMFEVLAHAPDVEFQPDILDFLCSGLWSSTETYTYPSPWDTHFGALPKITHMAQSFPAQNGYCSDTMTRLHTVPPDCPDSCSYTVYQWIVARKSGRDYLVNDRNSIERGFYFNDGIWNYCITARGNTFCTPKTW